MIGKTLLTGIIILSMSLFFGCADDTGVDVGQIEDAMHEQQDALDDYSTDDVIVDDGNLNGAITDGDEDVIIDDGIHDPAREPLMTGLYEYNGQIDSNSIEVKTVNDTQEYRVFRFSEDFKDTFDGYSLENGNFIFVEYEIDATGAKIIHSLRKE